MSALKGVFKKGFGLLLFALAALFFLVSLVFVFEKDFTTFLVAALLCWLCVHFGRKSWDVDKNIRVSDDPSVKIEIKTETKVRSQSSDNTKIICHADVDDPLRHRKTYFRRRKPPKQSQKLSDYITPLGVTIPACPSCGVELPKFYQRKAKCKDCGEDIYSRKRPFDGKKALLKESDLAELNKQNHIKDIGLKDYLIELEHFEAIREHLAEKRNTDPRNVDDGDVEWSLLNRELFSHAQDRQFGLYRNTLLDMARHHIGEKRYGAALSKLFDVFYFDINGDYELDFDYSIENDKDRYFWNAETAYVAPGIISLMDECINDGRISRENLHDLWIKSAKPSQQNYKFPISPEEGWKELNNHLITD